MPKSFLVRNPWRNSMTVSGLTTRDPTWDQQDIKPSTDNQHLSGSLDKEDTTKSLNLHIVAFDDVQASNSPIYDDPEPLNLSCRSGYDLRGDSSTNSEDTEPLDLQVPSEYHQQRSGLSKPKRQVGLSNRIRPQYHPSVGEKGEEGAVEGTQPLPSLTSGFHNAKHYETRRPDGIHPPIDSLLRQTLESRINDGNFFSQQLVACKLRSPHHSTDSSKRHRCCFCSKQFNDKFDLKRHIRTHTGVRPFKCDRCFRAFTQRCSLEIHQKKVHDMELKFAFKERRGKIYVCEHCGHSTNEINTHYAHTVQQHQGPSDHFPGAPGRSVHGLVSGTPLGQEMSGGFPVCLKQETQPYMLYQERVHVPGKTSIVKRQGMFN